MVFQKTGVRGLRTFITHHVTPCNVQNIHSPPPLGAPVQKTRLNFYSQLSLFSLILNFSVTSLVPEAS